VSEHQRESETDRVVVRDRRRIDPVTGEVRAPEAGSAASGAGTATSGAAPGSATGAAPSGSAARAGGSGAPTSGGVGEPGAAPDPAEVKLAELAAQLDERTADLQRVSAEYANYRRRVDRDREAITVAARAQVAVELLPVLDDLARAEAHGDLTGPFKAVADKLVGALTKLGLTPFGAEGDPFDPSVHEAVQHTTAPDVTGPTVTTVLRQGYRMGERLLRPAMVAVTDRDPEAGPAERPSDEGVTNEDNNE
jgi:molecular chaperone GrpE